MVKNKQLFIEVQIRSFTKIGLKKRINNGLWQSRLLLSNKLQFFSPDYVTARSRFVQGIQDLDWQLETYPITAKGSEGERLTVDVGYSSNHDQEKALVVTSGVHGVEGFFGSAVQSALLAHWVRESVPTTKCVFIHSLNPFGFSWLRRFDENNVDLNRNFLLSDQYYKGVSEKYVQFDSLLNPKKPPSKWEPFTAKALWAIVRYGMPALQRAVAGGQYHYPQGLFYGGEEPSQVHRLLEAHLPSWLQGCEHVIHLDLHTGLGSNGACQLLIDYTLSDYQRNWLHELFEGYTDIAINADKLDYKASGGFGPWCMSKGLAANYLFATAEFGTTGPLDVLRSLRAENQLHHWGSESSASTKHIKRKLEKVFCPSDENWRSQALKRGITLVDQALQGLNNI